MNLLGSRQTNIYGKMDFETYLNHLKSKYFEVDFHYYQSNVEGELINKIHEASADKFDGIIMNAGAYSHTSIAIADAISSVQIPCIEVHISNIFAREDYRQISHLAKNCVGSISGFGLKSYELAVQYFLNPL